MEFHLTDNLDLFFLEGRIDYDAIVFYFVGGGMPQDDDGSRNGRHLSGATPGERIYAMTHGMSVPAPDNAELLMRYRFG